MRGSLARLEKGQSRLERTIDIIVGAVCLYKLVKWALPQLKAHLASQRGHGQEGTLKSGGTTGDGSSSGVGPGSDAPGTAAAPSTGLDASTS